MSIKNSIGGGGSHGGGIGGDPNTIRDSMQYYRVWIYSCNSVLGITSAIFIVFAAFVLADVRLSLLSDVELYHPTFLYAYAALILQCGVIQAIGCLGAQRLSHKLLSIYWILLLILTIGDIVVGLVWVFKLERIKLNIRPSLTQDFLSKYSRDPSFTSNWNEVQIREHCCGVDGPLDFAKLIPEYKNEDTTSTNSDSTSGIGSNLLSIPDSCCTYKIYSTRRRKRNIDIGETTHTNSVGENPIQALGGNMNNKIRHFVHRKKVPLNGTNPPFDTYTTTSIPISSSSSIEDGGESSEISVPFICGSPNQHLPHENNIRKNQKRSSGSDDRRLPRHFDTFPSSSSEQSRSKFPNPLTFTPKTKIRVYRNGCGVKLIGWIDHTSGMLFILGFCIIGFVKICFLIILRYEIREMIEKIGILQLEHRKVISGPGGVNLPQPQLHSATVNQRQGTRYSIQKQFSTQSYYGQPTGITIKSPQGDSHFFSNSLTNHTTSTSYYTTHHHHIHHPVHQSYPYQVGYPIHLRRHSARSLGGCEPFELRGPKSQSQETVNMSLLIRNPRNRSGGGEEETISLKVPTPEEREAKRANFANHCTWDSNVSGDSSISYNYDNPPKQIVQVDLEKGIRSNGSSFEETQQQQQPLPLLAVASANKCQDGSDEFQGKNPCCPPSGDELEGNESSLAMSTASSQSPPSTASHSRLSLLRRNGNNNSTTSSIEIDMDSDFVMALIGTAV